MVGKVRITREQMSLINKHLSEVNNKGSFRFRPEKKKSMWELFKLHNELYETNYDENNISCPGCVRKVVSRFNKIIDSWQIDSK
tara:strand:- start:403 stop:654 length:252 start_codon:yes stop_codon:yes gene_type:complete